MKKKDLVLIGVVLFIALACLAVMKAAVRSGGNMIRITVDGKEYGTWSLDKEREIDVELDGGHNLICIEGGEAYMKEADCPDGYCMSQGHISNGNEAIICLPHRLVVEVITDRKHVDDNTEDGVDVVSE